MGTREIVVLPDSGDLREIGEGLGDIKDLWDDSTLASEVELK